MVLGSFIASLVAFTLIGVLSARRSAGTSEDYLLASRSVPAWLAALSSVATANSGFMFIGLIGFAYTSGVQVVWFQIAWLIGDALLWWRAHRAVRVFSETHDVRTASELIATDSAGFRDRPLAIVAAALTFLFLAGYAAAQLKAGSTALHILFEWDLRTGAVLGALVVVLYSIAGGVRASIWTDAAQSLVMLAAVFALLIACARAVPPSELFTRLEGIDPTLIDWNPDAFTLGIAGFVLSYIAGGLGTIGQPHVLVRTMALDSPASIRTARRIYFAWFVPFSIAVVGAGLYARVILPELGEGVEGVSAAELALPLLSLELLPEPLVGLMLAGLFAATMSTADSQLLACSAAITQDFAPTLRGSTRAAKAATLGVAALALGIALFASDGVFDLVLLAWAALGASLGPLVLLRIFGCPVPRALGLIMMSAGVATVALWPFTGLGDAIYKLLPGLLVPLTIYGVYALARPASEAPPAP